VSRISNDTKRLISAADVLIVSRSDETPGVFTEKLTVAVWTVAEDLQ